MRQRLHLLALVILALLGAGIVSPSDAVVTTARIVAAAESGADDSHLAATPIASRELDAVDAFGALEADLDDDDDVEAERHRHSALGWEAAVASRATRSPLVARRASPRAHERDPSRFAIGHGFARGPPV